jgi:hypothetical protein
MEQFEITIPELDKYMLKIYMESIELMDKFIKEKSPIQKDEIVDVKLYSGEWVKQKISSVKLVFGTGWGERRWSFIYEGLPMNKKGEVIKGRKPMYVFAFKDKEGKEYSVPSYYRYETKPASIQGRQF